MKPHSFAVALLAGITLEARGQMTLLNAQRAVIVGQNWNGDTAYDEHRVSGFGNWAEVASIPHAQARQNSTISDTGVEWHSFVDAYGGAGHHAWGSATLDLDFAIDESLRWDLTYVIWPRPASVLASLMRAGDSTDLFAGVRWYLLPGEEVELEHGYLEPGQYHLHIDRYIHDGYWPFYDDMTFNLSVPAPGSLFLTPLAALALTRRRRESRPI